MLKSIYLLFLTFLAFTATFCQAIPTSPTKLTPLGRTEHEYPTRQGCSTNAECLRTGRALIKPKRRQTSTGALAPRQSPGAPRVFDAIQVTGLDGTNYGYVQTLYNTGGNGILTYTQNAAQAMSVSYVESTNGDPVTFTVSVDDRPSFPSGYDYVAGLAWSGWYGSENELGPGDVNYAALTAGTTAYPPGHPYTGPRDTYLDNGDDSRGTETALWIVNPNTLQVTVQWTNNDNTGLQKPETSIVIWSVDSTTYLTGHPAQFINAFVNCYEVTFKLVNF